MAIPPKQMEMNGDNPPPGNEPMPLGKPHEGEKLESDRQGDGEEMMTIEIPKSLIVKLAESIPAFAEILGKHSNENKSPDENAGNKDYKDMVQELEMMR